MLDLMKWGQTIRYRKGVPSQEPGTQPAAAPAAAQVTEQAAKQDQQTADAPSEQTELEKLADLHDQGILTDEEYQAKKDQLEDEG